MISFIAEILYILIYQPLFNLLIFFYTSIPFADLGIAVILVTVLIKGVLYPLGLKAARSQKQMQEIQPEIKRLQEEYKDDKETQARKIMEVYKSANISPFSGMLPLLIQLPVLVSLFQIFRRGLESEEMVHLYNFVSAPEMDAIDPTLLGIIDLSSSHVVIAVLAGAGQYLQMKMTMGNKKKSDKNDVAGMMQSQMALFLPGFTFFILLTLPSAVGLYWIITILFSVFQQYTIKKEK